MEEVLPWQQVVELSTLMCLDGLQLIPFEFCFSHYPFY